MKQTDSGYKANEMTSDEQLVWGCLEPHEGQSHAVTKCDLAHASQMDADAVRRVITSLIFKHRKPIGSSTSRIGGGYYIMTDPEEAEKVSARLKGQAVKILQKAAVLAQISNGELYKQIQIEMEFE